MRRTRRTPALPAALVACLLGPVSARAQGGAPQPKTPIDWGAYGNESVRVLSNYLKINTTNPPGNELETARFLKAILDREGIPAEILDTMELGPNRANLYARLKGAGAKPAIALVNHMDVVPVTPEFWHVPPFSGEIRDGYLWGRGALDMKGNGIAQLMAMIALKRSGVPLERDIVFIGNADEEVGSKGAYTFVERHPDLLKDVGFLLTEGGANVVRNGRLDYYGVSVSEKRTFWHRITVHGVPSHGSQPTKENPVPRLVRALDRIAAYETPLEVTPAVEKFFHDISRNYAGEQQVWLADVKTALSAPRARAWILSDPYRNAILRNTISETALSGSNKTNVIPPEATADLDMRLLPDQDPDAFMATLKGIVADTAVHWAPLITPAPPMDNPIDTPLFHAIERAAHDRDPDALVTTVMLTGGTDRPAYRQLGIVTYGFSPFKIDAEESHRGVHGNDERIPVAQVGWGVHLLYDVLRYAQ